MNEHQVFFTLLVLLTFLLTGAMLQLVSNRTRVPFTFLMVFAGVGIAYLSSLIHLGPVTDEESLHSFFSQYIKNIKNFRLSPQIVFYLFLPTLVFESAFNIRFIQLRNALLHISGLAIFSVILSSGIIGLLLHLLFGIDLLIGLLFGVIISATDPVAVLGIFKEVGAPRRLRTIVEGESLFNDGTALVLFNILLAMFISEHFDGETTFSKVGAVWDFAVMVIGGGLFGIVIGYVFSKAIEMVRENRNVEMTLVLILAHSTFLFAEYIGVSGIIAAVAAGVVLGNFGRNKISPSVLETMQHFWDHMAFIVNSLVFLLIGISVVQVDITDYWVLSLAAVGIVIVARFVSVIPVLSVTNYFTKKTIFRIPFSWQIIIAHGGLRGALAVVMLLLLPPEFPGLQLLQAMTVTVIIFLFLFNATTIRWLLEKFGLMNFTPVDILEIEESHVLVAHSMRDHLQKIYHKGYVSEDVFRNISENYEKAEQKAGDKIKQLFHKEESFTMHELLFILRKHCLGVERKVFNQLFASEEISEHTLSELTNSIERQRERLLFDKKQERNRSSMPFTKRMKQTENRINYFLGSLAKIDFVERFTNSWKRRQIIHKHERYRARRISAWNVIKYLDELEKNDLFLEERVLSIVRNQYEKWHLNAQEKQLELEREFTKFLKHRKYYLTKRNCLNLEKELINDYFERDIITQRVHTALTESLESRTKRIRKDAIREEVF